VPADTKHIMVEAVIREFLIRINAIDAQIREAGKANRVMEENDIRGLCVLRDEAESIMHVLPTMLEQSGLRQKKEAQYNSFVGALQEVDACVKKFLHTDNISHAIESQERFQRVAQKSEQTLWWGATGAVKQ
jgi:hypothetical protein